MRSTFKHLVFVVIGGGGHVIISIKNNKIHSNTNAITQYTYVKYRFPALWILSATEQIKYKVINIRQNYIFS